mmetsp:Transcript_33792/g.73871  ORF Transcript_33792/g.73871 Transcript_33792/m.73871 type:complete len:263 (-) Transcript_33792:1352-2140(-)
MGGNVTPGGAVALPNGDVPVGADEDAAHLLGVELDGMGEEVLNVVIVAQSQGREPGVLPLVNVVHDAGDLVVPGRERGVPARGGEVGEALAGQVHCPALHVRHCWGGLHLWQIRRGLAGGRRQRRRGEGARRRNEGAWRGGKGARRRACRRQDCRSRGRRRLRHRRARSGLHSRAVGGRRSWARGGRRGRPHGGLHGGGPGCRCGRGGRRGCRGGSSAGRQVRGQRHARVVGGGPVARGHPDRLHAVGGGEVAPCDADGARL